METIWFQDKDPRTLNNPHNSNYNPLLGYRNWSEMPFDSRDYNFVMAPLHNLKDRVSEFSTITFGVIVDFQQKDL